MVQKLFEEFIVEADNGCVFDGEFYYNIHIHTNYQNDDVPVLKISNYNLFLKELTSYFDYAPLDKRNMAYLFTNLTTEDFNNPIEYVRRNKNFIINKLFDDKTIYNIGNLYDSHIKIEIKYYGLETPYSFNISIINDGDDYVLPLISYGISDDICYIYAINNKNNNDDNLFQKKIKRKLYSLNKNVLYNENDDYINYRNGSDYYPENISDVSPSALLAFSIFLNELHNKGITKIKLVSYLPVRYNNKEESNKRKAKFMVKKNKSLVFNDVLEELMKEQLRIQNNLTQKFLRNFFRLNFHFDNIYIDSYPYEVDEFMNITLGEFISSNNVLLDEIINKTCEKTRILIK